MIDVIVGDAWTDQLAFTYKSTRCDTFDLNLFADAVDLVVGQQNLTAHLEQERLFPFFASFLEAILEVVQGGSGKAFVECEESPWEFVISSHGSATFLLSFYSVSPEHEVLCHDHEVEATALIDAFSAQAVKLLEVLEAIAPQWANLRQARRLGQALRALSQTDLGTWGGAAEMKNAPHMAHRVGMGGLEMAIACDFGYHGLHHYSPDHTLDLHALLGAGSFEVCCHGEVLVQTERFSMLALWQWTEMVVGLACEGTLRQEDVFHLELEMEVLPQAWRLFSTQFGVGQMVSPKAVVGCTVELGQALWRAIEAWEPEVLGNARLLKWRVGLARLEEGPPLFVAQAVEGVNTSGVMGERGGGEERRFEWSWEQVRAIYPQMTWLRHVPGMDVRDVCVTKSLVCVRGVDLWTAFELGTGQPLWEQVYTERLRGMWVHWRDDMVVAQHGERTWWVVDALSGGTQAEIHLPMDLRECRHVEVGAETGELLVFGSRGEVVGIDLNRSAVMWVVRGESKGAFHHDMNEQVIAHLQGSVLTLIDRQTGQTLWRTQTGDYARDVRLHGDRVVVVHSGGARSQTHLRVLCVEAGQARQELSIDGRYVGCARSYGEAFWMVLERQRRPVVEMFWGQTLEPRWVHPLARQPRTLAPFLSGHLEVGGEKHVLVQTATQLVLIEEQTGRARWSQEYPALERMGIEPLILGDGVLSWGEGLELRGLGAGKLIRRFDEFLEEAQAIWAHGETLEVVVAEGANPAGVETLMNISYAYYLALV